MFNKNFITYKSLIKTTQNYEWKLQNNCFTIVNINDNTDGNNHFENFERCFQT